MPSADTIPYHHFMAIILSHPDILGGTPCFAGTRVPADSLFVYLGRGYTLDYFLSQFPSVRREQALALLELARHEVPELAQRQARQETKRAAR